MSQRPFGPAIVTVRVSLRVEGTTEDSTLLARTTEPALEATTGIVSARCTMLAESQAHRKLTKADDGYLTRYLLPILAYWLRKHE